MALKITTYPEIVRKRDSEAVLRAFLACAVYGNLVQPSPGPSVDKALRECHIKPTAIEPMKFCFRLNQ